MKKFIILAIGIILFNNVIAQENYLTFKNIPVAGHYNSFAKELRNQGFKLEKGKIDFYLYKGNFLSKPCKLAVQLNSNLNVQTVTAIFSYKNFSDVEEDFNKLVKLYSEKYGEATSYSKEIKYPYNKNYSLNNLIENEYMAIALIKLKGLDYESAYVPDDYCGGIIIKVDYNIVNDNMINIVIGYTNFNNVEKNDVEYSADIMSEI